MSLGRQLVLLVLLLALGGGGWWYVSQGPKGGAESGGGAKPPPVVVETVEVVEDSTLVEAVGTGQARGSVTLFPSVAGRVTSIDFQAGAKVNKGDVLLRLDNDAEKLAVRLAEVEVEQARQLLARYEKAVPTGGVPVSQVDAGRNALDRTRLQLDQARVALENRLVRAPFAGVMGIAQVDPGNRVTATTPITTLDDRSLILVSFTVPEMYAGAVHEGETVTLTAWSLPGRTFTGLIEATSSRLDPTSRSLTVRARVFNGDDVLRPGMSFGVQVRVRGHAYPAVSEVSVLWGREGAYVWRIQEGKAVKTPVRIVSRDGTKILVEGDLAAGQTVVSEGVQRVREGMEVQVLNPSSPTPETAPQIAPLAP